MTARRPGHRQAAGDLALVVTPWYPTARDPVWGTFVRDAVTALAEHCPLPVQVVHVDSSPLTDGERAGHGPASWHVDEQRPEAAVRLIRSPFPPDTARHRAIELHRRALAAHAADLIERAAVVSAHVGGPTGAAVAPLLPRRTRLTITEHATYVRGLFNDTRAAVAYRRAVARADAVLAVSDATARTLRALCPLDAARIIAVPNPVDVDALPLRPAPVRRHDRWLFVGNLVERKGVRLLLEAFAREVRDTGDDRPDLHLTLVGDGPLRAELESAARELPGRVTFEGRVAPDAVAAHYGRHDVLVHLSAHETFGLTLVEAAASGLPVVATRCDGPEETMVVPAAVGLCVLVDRSPTVEEVRAAVRRLRDDLTHDDLVTARQAVELFYGRARAADLQARHVLGTPPARPLAAPLDLDVALVLHGRGGWERLRPGAVRCAALGARVSVVDLDRRLTPVDLPDGVRLVSSDDGGGARAGSRRGPVHLLERLPRWTSDRATRLASRLPGRLPGRVLRGVTATERAGRRLSLTSWRRAAERLPGQALRPQATTAALWPHLPGLSRPDVVVLQRRTPALDRWLTAEAPGVTVHLGAFSAADVARWWLHRRATTSTTSTASSAPD